MEAGMATRQTQLLARTLMTPAVVVVHLDDRAAGADDLFLDLALQSARPRVGTVRRPGELRIFSDRSGLPGVAAKYARAGRLGACADDPDRHSAGASARPAGD